MKKFTVVLLLAAVAAFSARAGVILSETFSYADGPITTASGSPWTTHSGTAGQADVLSGALNLTFSEGEDINAPIAGAPYLAANPGALFSSFKLKLTSLPNAVGSYMAHFRDNNTGAATGFGGRIWLSTTNAIDGGLLTNKFRVTIANGSSATAASGQLPMDLDLNTTYVIVTRFVPSTGVATLWVNPAVETDASVTATDVGVTRPNPIDVTSYAFRQNAGMGAMLVDDLQVGTQFNDVAGANRPPTITSIAAQRVGANTATAAIPFVIGDDNTAASSLVVQAFSANQALVPNANLALGGSGAARTITVTPAAGQQGSAIISIVVLDGENNYTTNSFTLFVGTPYISDIPNIEVAMNSTSAPIAFVVNDAETPQALVVTATCTNSLLLPPAGLLVQGSGTNRTLTIVPALNATGLVTVVVTVSDGTLTSQDTLQVTVYPQYGVLTQDDFNRADGPLFDFSGKWISNGGTGTTNYSQAMIEGNAMRLTQDQSEDLYTDIIAYQSFYNPQDGVVLYAGYSVKFTQLPSSSGAYFTHFSDGGTVNFRGRVFATTLGAAPGQFRLAVGNNTSTVTTNAVFPQDLSTNVTYTVVVRYNVSTGVTRLWVNPLTEDSTSILAADTPSPSAISEFVLRQNSGMGSLLLDNLKVATGFQDVYLTPNLSPTISSIADQTTHANESAGPLSLIVGDDQVPAGNLVIIGTSDNQTLLPDANIVINGSGSNRTVTVIPAPGAVGIAHVTLSVADDVGQKATTTFNFTVLGQNNAPFISDFVSRTNLSGQPTPAISFQVADKETAPDLLVVAGYSDNQALVPNANIVFSGSGSNRTVVVTPLSGQVGSVRITITVADDVFVVSNSFTLTVEQDLLLNEGFNYPNGSAVTNSAFVWRTHSGTTGETQIANGRMLIKQAPATEDINTVISTNGFTASSGATLYAAFTVNFSVATTNNGYFAHFKDGASNFRARLYVTTNTAAAGAFRLAIMNNAGTYSSTTAGVFPLDLVTGADYRVLIRYVCGTGVSTLWVNPASESSASATPTDAPSTTVTLSTFAFRQTTSIGEMAIDDLRVGRTFASVLGAAVVVPSPTLSFSQGASGVQFAWPVSAAGFTLQYVGSARETNWQAYPIAPEVKGNQNVVTINPVGATNSLFRLRK
jgi:hypothetical protein